jgi:hypothetical protein
MQGSVPSFPWVPDLVVERVDSEGMQVGNSERQDGQSEAGGSARVERNSESSARDDGDDRRGRATSEVG